MSSFSVKKGDTVMVITGQKGKDGIRGKTGKVLVVDSKNHKVIVEGLRMQKHHTKARDAKSQAGIIEKEGPIDISNVMVVCPKCGKPTRVGHTFDENGKKVRVCKKKIDGAPCGGVLDKGAKAEKKAKAEKTVKKAAEGEKKTTKKTTTKSTKTSKAKVEKETDSNSADA